MRRSIYLRSFFPLLAGVKSGRNMTKMSGDMYVFDRAAKIKQKERALDDPDSKLCRYLKDEVGYRLFDNLLDIKRQFKTLVELGSGYGSFSKHVTSDLVDEFIMCESSSKLLDNSEEPQQGVNFRKMIVDEQRLPFEPNSIDCFVSNLTLHWVNDLPGTFYQIFFSLKNDGAFMGTIFGGETLYEMRTAFQLADMERCGGITSHVSPFTRVQDIGDILTRCGFTLLTIHSEEIVVGYPSLFELMWDLKSMGENNAAINRCTRMNKDVVFAAAAIYEQMYGNDSSHIKATFQIINFIAWKPDASQPKPLRPGSAKMSLKDLSKIDEIIKKKGTVDSGD